MVLQLKHLCKLYDRRVSLALIPFLQEKRTFLREEIEEKRANQENQNDIEYLEQMLTNVDHEFKEEKETI